MILPNAVRALTLALAAARATRFFTTDTLGEWAIVGPAKRWAISHAEPSAAHGPLRDSYDHMIEAVIDADHMGDPVPTPPRSWGWRAKLVKGLDCPFCVGFWVGALILAGEVTLGRLPVVGTVWRFGVSAFALNYVVGHVSARLDG